MEIDITPLEYALEKQVFKTASCGDIGKIHISPLFYSARLFSVAPISDCLMAFKSKYTFIFSLGFPTKMGNRAFSYTPYFSFSATMAFSVPVLRDSMPTENGICTLPL